MTMTTTLTTTTSTAITENDPAVRHGSDDLHEIPDNERGTTMRAVVQDVYGSADVLTLRDVARPQVGDDDVLVRVRAAGVHIGDVHVMTGTPYLMRIMGFGFRAPKARVRGWTSLERSRQSART
jgi:hypothetical protein